MKEYVRQRGDRYYAVIYEGRDPVTGKERRTSASSRNRPGRSRASRRQTRRRRDRPSRCCAVVDVRCLPDRAVAANQEAAPRHQHLPRVRTQRAAPRSADARQGGYPPTPLPADRSALRLAAALHHRPRVGAQDCLRDPPRHQRCARRSVEQVIVHCSGAQSHNDKAGWCRFVAERDLLEHCSRVPTIDIRDASQIVERSIPSRRCHPETAALLSGLDRATRLGLDAGSFCRIICTVSASIRRFEPASTHGIRPSSQNGRASFGACRAAPLLR
jgi:hypothetical protein